MDTRGVSHAEEWERLSQYPYDLATAQHFLANAGVDQHTRALLAEWNSLNPTSFERPDDIADVLGHDPDEMKSVVANLAVLGVVEEHQDEYKIDPVVARALHRLA